MRAPATRPALTLALALLASPAAHAACNLADIVPGGTYTYRMTGPGSGTFTTTNAVKGSSVRATTTIEGRTSTMTWTCTARGLSGTLTGAQGGGMTMNNSAFLPPLNVWRPGYSWTSTQDMSMSGGMTSQGSSVTRIVKRETVKVPAGTFNAWRLDTTTTVKITLPGGRTPPAGSPLAGGTTVQSSVWYAPGTGMIRSVNSGMTTELVKFKR